MRPPSLSTLAIGFAILIPLAAQAQPAGWGVEPQAGPRRRDAWPVAVASVPTARQKVFPGLGAPESAGELVAVGALIGAAAFFGGAYLGAAIENRAAPCSCDDPGLAGALLGAVIAPAFAIPIGVHVANEGRGSFGATLGSSVLAGATGLLLGSAMGELGWTLIVPPLVEIAAAVVVERATTR